MYGPLTVLMSAAGYYIGRMYYETDVVGNKVAHSDSPGTRESGYYPTKKAAVEAVRKGFKLRHCPENDMAFIEGKIKTCPGDFYQDENFQG